MLNLGIPSGKNKKYLRGLGVFAVLIPLVIFIVSRYYV